MRKGGMNGLMKQAQKMQKQMMEAQEKLGEMVVEGSAGGGMVKVVVNGKQMVTSIAIEKEVVDPEDVDMLQDMIVAAVNDGIVKSQEMVNAEMAKITGGMNIPGMM